MESVVKQLEELYFAKEPVTIVTSDATYTSMAIESLTISKSLETGYAPPDPDFLQEDPGHYGQDHHHPRQLWQERSDGGICRDGQYIHRQFRRVWFRVWVRLRRQQLRDGRKQQLQREQQVKHPV